MRKNKISFLRKINLAGGFTLAEVIIAALIMVILGSGVIAVLRSGDQLWSNDMGLIELLQGARHSIYGMSRELRQSNPGAISISGNSTINFSIVDSVTNVSSPVTYNVKYYLDGNKLIRENPSNGTACSVSWNTSKCNILVSNVDNLTFCCIGAGSCSSCSSAHTVKIDMSTSKIVRGRTLSIPLIRKVKLRNE